MSQEAISATDSRVTGQLPAKPRSVWASPIRRREARDGIVFILPWFLGLLIFILGPFVAGFYYSLTEYDSLMPANWLGLDNY